MRPQKVLEKDILTGLAKVFRSKGYEGASLNDLAEATGLKKASLYHRFPNGKEEMAEAVLDYIGQWVEDNIFRTLSDESNPPSIRLQHGLNEIKTLYDGGKEVCIFRALSMEVGLKLFAEHVNTGMKRWIAAFEEVGLALGQSNEEAEDNAFKTLIEVQGSLIVAKGLGDVTIFTNALQHIEKRYLSD